MKCYAALELISKGRRDTIISNLILLVLVKLLAEVCHVQHMVGKKKKKKKKKKNPAL
eukprot:NODE_24102_length_638_cov_3.395303.p3 GENE.NODE_24102_length_638_cov_3.395303~~NODE_24102_length_638_cov_3.395303.p3  ORF type:complete len:57 (-),score=18.27 NODE_24102_length_638_cov_3.395303:80-250(-)